MRRATRLLSPALALAAALAVPPAAYAVHDQHPRTKNMHPLGEAFKQGAVDDPVGWDTRSSDIAFWGKRAIQGRYDGFRVIDISNRNKPRVLAHHKCISDQGDVGVFGNLVFRATNSGQLTDQCTTDRRQNAPGSQVGWEGIQIFDIRDLKNIKHIASVALDCGSHTFTVVPDIRNRRVLLYNSTSQSNNQPPNALGFPNRCTHPFNRFDIVEVPLANPAAARIIGAANLGVGHDGMPIEMCHDIGVIFGKVNKAACAGHHEAVVFDITDRAKPRRLFSIMQEAVSGWHSASFTWDGKVIALGWEPGGGTRPRCQVTGAVDAGTVVTDEMKQIFFHSAEDGMELGRWLLPRPQSSSENCTIHNYNIVPHRSRYLLLHGSYQSGTSLVDFTDVQNAYEVGYVDPLPLMLKPGDEILSRGGAWTSSWYNGLIYESDTRRGLMIYRTTAKEVKGALRLPWLNPATQEFSLSDRRDRDDDEDEDDD